MKSDKNQESQSYSQKAQKPNLSAKAEEFSKILEELGVKDITKETLTQMGPRGRRFKSCRPDQKESWFYLNPDSFFVLSYLQRTSR
jgi:hypothetical protein